MKALLLSTASAMMFALAASAAHADALPNYPNAGTENPVVYTFTVANTGTVTAYFAGSDAGNDSTLGFYTNVNGNPMGSGIFPNHSTPVGASYVLGSVNAGDILTFYIDTVGPNTFYSNPALNSDGQNHVYSASYAGGVISGATIPAGTYVGFEDLPGGGDHDYNDLNFVFTNTISSVPLPASAPMFGAALLALGALGYGMKRKASATA